MTRDELIEELKKLPNVEVYVEVQPRRRGETEVTGKITGIRTVPNAVIEAESCWL